MVPIDVNFKFKQTKKNLLNQLTIVVDENPSPVVGKFSFYSKNWKC